MSKYVPFFFLLFVPIFGFSLDTTYVSFTGKVLIDEFPKFNQLYERIRTENYAVVTVKGRVSQAAAYNQMTLVVSDSLGNLNQVSTSLTYENDTAVFELFYQLPAGFTGQNFQLFGMTDSSQTLEWAVENVVAGDVILINGQSNAQAYLSPMPEDVVPYTRGYSGGYWGELDKSFPGRWGAHLAKLLALALDYPVAVFNFADGAQPIWYFQKNLQDTTAGNYGKMLRVFAEANVKKPVAAFWFHGEANGWDTDMLTYKMAYDTLHNSWKQDLDIEDSYIFQLRYRGCAHFLPDIFEAQRQVAEEHADIQIMSTTNADHDSCHYHWENGYKILAARMSKLVLHETYGNPIANEDRAPNPRKLLLKDAHTIYVLFEPAGVPLTVMGNPSADFRVEEMPDNEVLSVSTSADTLIVTLSQPVSLGVHLSYLSHPGSAPDWVVTPSGVGILEFYNLPVTDLVAVRTPGSNQAIEIFPNPVRDVLSIRLPQNAKGSLRLIDSFGRVALRQKIAGKAAKVDVSHLPAGIYCLVLPVAGRLLVQTVVVER